MDATERDLLAGEIRFVDPKVNAGMMFMPIHNIPLNYLIDEFKAFAPDVKFIVAQLQTATFYYPMFEAITQAAQTIYQRLAYWKEAKSSRS